MINSDMLSCELWFPTPIWWTKFSDLSDDEYKTAIDFCYSKSNNSQGRIVSNVGGWQSNIFTLEEILDTPLNIFIQKIKHLLPFLTRDIGVQKNLKFSSFWININKQHNFNQIHDHPGSDFSGVFYLNSSESKIKFYRDRDIMDYYLRYHDSSRQTLASYETVVFKAEKGKVLFFPSWLLHEVETNLKNSDRISIAFNMITHNI